MIRSVLAAADLTEASDPVVRAAAALAGVTGGVLHVVHAIEVPVLPYAAPGAAAERIDAGRSQSMDRLAAQVQRSVPGGQAVGSAEVLVQPVHDAVLTRAAEVDADLIVVGPHRLRAFGDRFLGSTADRVVRTSGVPVLLVRGALDLPLRRVVVPTDLSERSNAAIEVAVRWAEALGASDAGDGPPVEVQVLHIVPRIYEMPDFAFDDEVIAPELERILAPVRARATRPGSLRARVTWGDLPADEIVRAAAAEQADLLVVATQGHGAVRRALLGSVASAVARRAPCPLLLVPPSADGDAND